MKGAVCYISARSVHSCRWMEAFHKRGYNVSFTSDFQTWLAPRPEGVPTYVFPTLTIRNIHRRLVPNALIITRILRKIKPDLVHIHTQHHYAPVVAASRVPFILTSWGLEVLMLSRMSVLRKVLAKYAAMEARKVTVDAECLKRIWVSMGVPQDKVEVIPFGVDVNMFNPSVDGRGVRKKLDVKRDDVVVVSVRSFFPHYDMECLVKAIPGVVRKHPNVKFVIKGEGPLKEHVMEMAKKLDVYSYTRFISPVLYSEIPRYLAAGDIYVSTSFVDTTSVSLLEGMACGLPSVTTDIVGNREWIRNGVNGLLYPPKDHNALADRIIQLVENEQLRKDFGERSRQIIMERAAWEECVSKMEAIYNEFL